MVGDKSNDPDSYQDRVARALQNGEPIPDFPSGDISELKTNVLGLHELYLTYLSVGFIPGQALYLTAAICTGNPGPAPDVKAD